MTLSIQQRFKEQAIKWVEAKVRYRHRGVNRQGCDCSGLLIGLLKEIGFLTTYDLGQRTYPFDWNLHTGAGDWIEEGVLKVANEIPNNSIEEGDILAFRLGRCIAHLGILIDKKGSIFVHSLSDSKRCVYGVLKNSPWTKRWVKSFRLDSKKLEKFNRNSK